ncbi:hypothetical protein DF3PB_1090002 [uncultured Defluviicoccus sp.]|uniref:Uncharacterized protein n=1 Tax=metagenome TaxID=256318 RepID=A0A380T808_9ZZZZ|nr:hypothetical protein DF3PB_1090002 [uncultured Defluviicoccus sp.]
MTDAGGPFRHPRRARGGLNPTHYYSMKKPNSKNHVYKLIELPPHSGDVWVTPRWEQDGSSYRFYEGYWN